MNYGEYTICCCCGHMVTYASEWQSFAIKEGEPCCVGDTNAMAIKVEDLHGQQKPLNLTGELTPVIFIGRWPCDHVATKTLPKFNGRDWPVKLRARLTFFFLAQKVSSLSL